MLGSIPPLDVAWDSHNQWMIFFSAGCAGIALCLSIFGRFFKKY